MGKQDSDTFEIRCHHKRYGKLYTVPMVLDLRPLQIQPNTFIWAWLAHMQNRSQRKSIESQVVTLLWVAIKLLAEAGGLTKVLAKDAAELTVSDIRILFNALEATLHAGAYSSNFQSRVSSTFRCRLLETLTSLGAAPNINSVSVQYKTTLRTHKRPRGLISDLDLTFPPLGATPHSNVRDLKKTMLSNASAALLKIQKGCVDDLQAGRRLRDHIHECAELPPAMEVIEAVQSSLVRGRMVGTYKIIQHYSSKDMRHVVGAIAICIRANSLAGMTPRIRWDLTGVVNTYLARATGNEWRQRMVFAAEAAEPNELNAAIILIQSYTGWNVSSVLELERRGVRIGDQECEVQSFKDKTDDETPMFPFGKEHPGAREALELLLWNDERLVELGLKKNTDSRLWWSAHARRFDGRTEPQHFIREFSKRHNLPKFSPEQLRNQNMFVNNLRSPIDVVKRMAGHGNLATTGGYFDNEVVHRLNSSISLEFSTRLQEEIKYSIGLRAANPSWRHMLAPVGDGSSCANPNAPPHGLRAGEKQCSARECHLDGGCLNRRLLIDEDRMREIVHTRNLYASNWQRLHGRNPAEFAHMHIPSMLFNEALYRICKTGIHANIFSKIERDLLQIK